MTGTAMATDVLVVGGGPGGMMAAITAAQHWPGKRVLVVRKETEGLTPCGIPYIVGTLGDVDDDLAGIAPLKAVGGELVVGEVVAVNREQKKVTLADGSEIQWQRLVLATGTEPFVPPIPGADLKGVFSIWKDYDYLDRILAEVLPETRELVIIGGGFIGVEFADETRKKGLKVSIIEMQPHLLPGAFDVSVSARVEKKLAELGIEVLTNAKVAAIVGPGAVEKVVLADGREIPAQAVLMSIGVKRNTKLAQDMGLTQSRAGGIWVDAFQRSREDHSIFAVGDCAHKQDFLTRRSSQALLASQAAAEGRIAGMNLFAIQQTRHNAGSIAIYSSMVDDTAFGVAGITEQGALNEGIPVLVGEAELPDHHPATMPGTQMMHCRLIFTRYGGHLIGGQVVGGQTTAEVLNAIGIAIQAHLTATDLASFQFGSHPRLTAPVHPVVAATGDAIRKLRKDEEG